MIENHWKFHRRTRVVMFLGTPHRGADINGWGVIVPSARLLLDYGADVNARGRRGVTRFHQAAFFGDLMLVK